MKKIQFKTPEGRSSRKFKSFPLRSEYEIWVGHSILNHAGEAFGCGLPRRAFIIADRQLKSEGVRLSHFLEESGWSVEVLFIRASENLKDFRQVYPLYGWLLEKGADRESVLYAVGGGVIGDVVGFVAGTYLRGIRWVGIPTTLLAQVDSSVGGKTGMNHEKGKNLIGLICQPSLVICDLVFLQTLPRRELISGFGEIIKYGLIFDPPLFRYLKRNWEKLIGKELLGMKEVIHRCLSWKVQITGEDERDRSGLRAILNFGHTLGHALEVESGFGYFRHGEAVIWGMRAACILSQSRGYLEEKIRLEIDHFLKLIPVPKIPLEVSSVKCVGRLKWDKKKKAGKTQFVLLRGIGKPILDTNLSTEDIIQALENLKGGDQD